MPSFYAIRDSILVAIEQDAPHVSIHLRAIRNEANDGKAAAPGLLRQEIRLAFENAEMEIDSSNLPTYLLEGSFSCESVDTDQPGIATENVIPATIHSATGVKLSLSGLLEDSGEYITINVNSESLKLEPLGAPEPTQYTRATI
ncbi:MAG: hypothetical protein KGN79_11850 [Acidobacteriota bacterium]|nr:hypothetical protein [Acidobacteriota bacterium]